MDYFVYIFIAVGIAVLVIGLLLLHRKYMVALMEKRIATYQNDLIVKYYDEVQNIYNQMRGWRHDYHNHIQAMKALSALGRSDQMDEYLGNLDADLTSVDTVLETGNVMVDAIVNSKISLAVSKNIKVNAKAYVPHTLPVSEIDLCVIIGNLLDNSMEACEKQPNEEDRFIRIYIGTYKELFYISVANAVGGEVKKLGKSYLSTKDSPSHGFGLIRIDKIVVKYNGFINRQNEEGMFVTEIMLPL